MVDHWNSWCGRRVQNNSTFYLIKSGQVSVMAVYVQKSWNNGSRGRFSPYQ